MAKHSPAPFCIESFRLIKDAHGLTVATVVYEDEAERERANAALLAAAPELLAACELVKKHLTMILNNKGDSIQTVEATIFELSKAIAKAKGA